MAGKVEGNGDLKEKSKEVEKKKDVVTFSSMMS
jgi:hypothetical protein